VKRAFLRKYLGKFMLQNNISEVIEERKTEVMMALLAKF
jgi:hypothetical protein